MSGLMVGDERGRELVSIVYIKTPLDAIYPYFIR